MLTRSGGVRCGIVACDSRIRCSFACGIRVASCSVLNVCEGTGVCPMLCIFKVTVTIGLRAIRCEFCLALALPVIIVHTASRQSAWCVREGESRRSYLVDPASGDMLR